MKIPKDMQKDILLESFEVLKTNYEKNYLNISDTIGKMAVIDIDTAMDMIEHIFVSNPSLVVYDTRSGLIFTNPYCPLTSNIIECISNYRELSAIADAIASRPKIIEVLFGKSGHISRCECLIIAEYISRGEIEIANEILQLISANKNNTGVGGSLTLSGILQAIIDKLGSDASENAVDFVHYWIQQIQDSNDKAKANVKFLDFFIKKE